MKFNCLLIVAALASVSAKAQVTITSDDMFNQAGQYYLAYSNPFDPTATNPTPYPTGGVQGSAGPNQIWDFSQGPTNVVYRFDYLAPTNVDSSISTNFPQATLVEMQTDQATGDAQYLFFSMIPGVGRQVYGFYAPNPLFDPNNVFTTPIVDFPSQIIYGQEWTTVATWINNVSGSDPTNPTSGGFSIAEQVVQTSDLKADAWGTVNLPDELGGFGQALRISEAVTYDLSFDDGSGNFQHAETDYARNFYWLMPGRGIVAELASTQGSTPPADNFTTATQFWRMFQTNKKPSTNTTGCATPDPVSTIKIKVNSGQVLLSWTKANCATQYQVQYSTNPSDATSWQTLNTVTNQVLALDNPGGAPFRFYRIVSLK
jgi:hypothetical protein